ncbi:MAG: hypothetical protein H0X37_25605 [Herpetosiphonaceae bacterium]|nr:hypothetical protein [Herpetosiphonaceae bacterium]
MDELVKQVMERTGISEEQARGAIQTVAEFVKAKLPPPFAGQVDAFLSGAPTQAIDPVQGLLGSLGGMFNM